MKDETLGPYKTILIAGPTAGGKSGLALALAQKYQGVIINTDSMQVYSALRIVTARPSEIDEALAPHRLYGHVDGHEAYSTGAWLRSVQALVPQLRDEFLTLIFVGGTGLYFNALTLGLSEIPAIPVTLRQNLRDELKADGSYALYVHLLVEDPASAAQLKATDGQRIIRALEVLRHTGRSLRAWQSDSVTPLIDLDACSTKAIVINPDREVLRQKIAERFKVMVAAGALKEIQHLIDQKLDPQVPVMKAIGVKELGAYLAGSITLDSAIDLAVIASRQYAKRQRTWFAGQMDARWLRVADVATAYHHI